MVLHYIKCPTCSTIIATRFGEYLEELEIVRNTTYDKKSKINDKAIKEQKAAELLDKYGYVNLCCRMRIMGFVDFGKIIT